MATMMDSSAYFKSAYKSEKEAFFFFGLFFQNIQFNGEVKMADLFCTTSISPCQSLPPLPWSWDPFYKGVLGT